MKNMTRKLALRFSRHRVHGVRALGRKHLALVTVLGLFAFLFGLVGIAWRLDRLTVPFVEQHGRRHSKAREPAPGGSWQPASCPQEARRPWRKSDKMTLVVVGGASYLGYHLTTTLLDEGHNVKVIDRFSEDILPRSTATDLELHMKRLRLEELLKVGSPDLVVYEQQEPCDLAAVELKHEISHVVFIPPGTFHENQKPNYVNQTIACAVRIIQTLAKYNHVHLTVVFPSSSIDMQQDSRERPSNTESIDEVRERLSFRSVMEKSVRMVSTVAYALHKIPSTILRTPETFGTWSSFDQLPLSLLEKLHSARGQHSPYRSDYPIGFQTYDEQFATVQDIVRSIMSYIWQRHSCKHAYIEADKISLQELYDQIRKAVRSIKSQRHNEYQENSVFDFFHLNSTFHETFDMFLESYPLAQDFQIVDGHSNSVPALATVWEFVHWYERNRQKIMPTKKQDYIFSAYIVGAGDPQRNIKNKPDNIHYMKVWYFSLMDNKMKAVVFHDCLSKHFIKKFPRDIKFQLASVGGRSTNDARFYAYFDYLKESPDIQRILLTDISDVEFMKNPFELMDALGDYLYIGRDIDTFPNMASMGWLMDRVKQCFSEQKTIMDDVKFLKNVHYVYNAGVIGGVRSTMLQFLEKVTRILDLTPSEMNCNMPVVNYVVHKYFDTKVFTGFPLTSQFFRFQGNPQDVYIIHK